MPIYEFDAEEAGQGPIRVAVEAPDEAAAKIKVQAMGYVVLGLYRIHDLAEATRKPKPPPDLVRPPRRVPPLAYLSNLFGGFYNQFAWGWLGMSVIFVWAFIGTLDPRGMYDFSGEVRNTQGTVTDSKAANTKINGSQVYETNYTFTADDGRRMEGISYSIGGTLERGSTVAVEYPKDRPERSRIQGMARRTLSAGGPVSLLFVLFIIPFLVIGFMLLFVGLRSGIRANRLLANGKAAYGRLKSREETATRINNQIVWKLTFGFTAEDGTPAEAIVKTHQVGSVTDDPEEKILYDFQNLRQSVLLDNLPGGATIDNHGQVIAGRPVRATLSLLLPAIVLTVHALIFYYLFIR